MRPSVVLAMLPLLILAACASGSDASGTDETGSTEGGEVETTTVSDVTLEVATTVTETGDGQTYELELTVRNGRAEGIAIPEVSELTLHVDETPDRLVLSAEVPRSEPLEGGAIRDSLPTVPGVGVPAGGEWHGTASVDLPGERPQAIQLCVEVLPLPGLGPEVLELPIEQPGPDVPFEFACTDASPPS